MRNASLQLCMTAHALGPVCAGCAHPVVPSPLMTLRAHCRTARARANEHVPPAHPRALRAVSQAGCEQGTFRPCRAGSTCYWSIVLCAHCAWLRRLGCPIVFSRFIARLICTRNQCTMNNFTTKDSIQRYYRDQGESIQLLVYILKTSL